MTPFPVFSDIRLRRVKSQAVKFCDCNRKVKYAVGVLRFVGFGKERGRAMLVRSVVLSKKSVLLFGIIVCAFYGVVGRIKRFDSFFGSCHLRTQL